MRSFVLVLCAVASMASAAFAQENSAPPADQKQSQCGDTCCGKDCCKHMAAKKDKGAKKDKSVAMKCCK